LPVKVSYTTYALTAGSSNYTATAGIVNFAPGVTSTNITVPILNDHVIDPTDNSPSNSSPPQAGHGWATSSRLW
jgi:hypothetical protein